MTTTALDRHRPSLLSSEPRSGPYARPPRCREHPRRTRACDACRRYQTWTTRRHRLSLSQGEPLTVPIEDVRGHLRRLQDAGMLLHEISHAADVNRNTISGILYKANTQYVCRDNARRILALPVPVNDSAPPCSNLIPAVGTLRRVQALARLGWTFAHIIAAGGSAIHRLDQLKGQEWVTERFASAVKTAYAALSMQRGPSVYTAGRAAKKGWPPPLAWDDDTIDDPNAQPNLGDTGSSDDYDETTVGQAVEGRLTYAQIAVHRPDLIETVRQLAKTLTDVEISHLLRWPGANDGRPSGTTRAINAITKLRLDNGIPAHRRPAVIPHRPHRRKNKAA